MDLLNPPTTTATARTEPNRNRPQITRRLRAAGFLLLWLGSIAFYFHHPATGIALSLFAIAAFLGDYCRLWRQNTEAFNRYLCRTARKLGPPTDDGSIGPDPITPEHITIEHAAPQVAKPCPGQDAPPAMDAHQRSLANYLSTPNLWN